MAKEYKAPKIRRINETLQAAGDCDTGSGDANDCTAVGNSAGDNCHAGNIAINACSIPGNDGFSG